MRRDAKSRLIAQCQPNDARSNRLVPRANLSIGLRTFAISIISRKGLFRPGIVMERFIRRENIRRYLALLERTTTEVERQRLLKLIAEERQKQKDAGDPPEP